jgi:hypothetical protein
VEVLEKDEPLLEEEASGIRFQVSFLLKPVA